MISKRYIINAIKKDIIEYLRSKKNILFFFALLSIALMMAFSTIYLPVLIKKILSIAPSLITDQNAIFQTLLDLFPNTLKENMAILTSDIVIFFGAVVVFSTYNIIPKEIESGKWIIPMCVGYNKNRHMAKSLQRVF